MKKQELLALYERLYFHEIDSREKLNSRLQTPLALIISFVGALAFMLQNFNGQTFSWYLVSFLFFLSFGAFSLGRAIYCFIRSWYNNTYEFLPSAENTASYLKTLEDTYAPYDNGKQLTVQHFDDYLRNYYIKCSSTNTECNDRRSIYAHKTNTALIATAIILLLAFLSFFLGNLDKTHAKMPTEVKIINPVEITGGTMTENRKPDNPSPPPQPPRSSAPPPPPPPPPPRLIREGIEVVKPNTPPKK